MHEELDSEYIRVRLNPAPGARGREVCMKRDVNSRITPSGRQGYQAGDSELDLIYVNGGNNLENFKTSADLWKVRLMDEDFHRLMFEAGG